MASDCAHGDCGRFSANGAGGPARKTKDERKAAGREGGEAGMDGVTGARGATGRGDGKNA